MIIIDEQKYPVFYKCKSKTEFNSLLKQADKLLGYPNGNTDNYCNILTDKNGIHYFQVNKEVSELVDYKKCIEFSNIEFDLKIKQ